MAAEAVSAMEAKLEAMRKELEDLHGAMKVKDGEIHDLRKKNKEKEDKEEGQVAYWQEVMNEKLGKVEADMMNKMGMMELETKDKNPDYSKKSNLSDHRNFSYLPKYEGKMENMTTGTFN